MSPGAVKGTRDKTPVDELGTDDELQVREQEERAAKRIKLDDSSCEEASSSADNKG